MSKFTTINFDPAAWYAWDLSDPVYHEHRELYIASAYAEYERVKLSDTREGAISAAYMWAGMEVRRVMNEQMIAEQAKLIAMLKAQCGEE